MISGRSNGRSFCYNLRMAKLYQVVDKNDELVGHKLRDEIDFNNDIYRISALWLTNSKDEVLMAQRVWTKDKDPGKWGPAAAGTLEEGETYETNIYKEAEEEIGLKGVTLELGPKQYFDSPRQAFCQWFKGVTDKSPDEFILQEEEVEQVAWVPKAQLKKDVAENPDKYVPSMSEVLALMEGLSTQ